MKVGDTQKMKFEKVFEIRLKFTFCWWNRSGINFFKVKRFNFYTVAATYKLYLENILSSFDKQNNADSILLRPPIKWVLIHWIFFIYRGFSILKISACFQCWKALQFLKIFCIIIRRFLVVSEWDFYCFTCQSMENCFLKYSLLNSETI